MMERFRGKRTIIVNAVMGACVLFLETLVPAMLALIGMPEFRHIVPEGWWPWIVVAVNVVNMVFRADTKTPMWEKD